MIVRGHDSDCFMRFKCLTLTSRGNFVLCKSLRSAVNSASAGSNACYGQAMLCTFANCFVGKSHADSDCCLIVSSTLLSRRLSGKSLDSNCEPRALIVGN